MSQVLRRKAEERRRMAGRGETEGAQKLIALWPPCRAHSRVPKGVLQGAVNALFPI